MAANRSYWKLYHLARDFGLTDDLARRFPGVFRAVLGLDRTPFGTAWDRHPVLRARALKLLLTPPKVVPPPAPPPRFRRRRGAAPMEIGEWEVTVHYELDGNVVDITVRFIGPDRPTSNDVVRKLFFAIAFGHGTPLGWRVAAVDWRREGGRGRRRRVSEGSGNTGDLENFAAMIRSHGARVRVERVDT